MLPNIPASARVQVRRGAIACVRTFAAGCAGALLVLAGAPSTPSATDEAAMVEAESEIQSIFVHLPPTLPRQGPVRVVVALHGMGGNGEDFSREFLQMTDANNWLVVAPTIAYGHWTDPAQVANEEPVLIGWLNAYLDAWPVEVGLSVASRVLLLGYSRGAQLALRFAEFHPERVRGVAAVAAGTYTLPLSVDAANHSMTFPFGIADL